jgi:hypothetical protein
LVQVPRRKRAVESLPPVHPNLMAVNLVAAPRDFWYPLQIAPRLRFVRRRQKFILRNRSKPQKREVRSAQSIRSSSYCREESFRSCCEDRENSIRYKLRFVKKFPS